MTANSGCGLLAAGLVIALAMPAAAGARRFTDVAGRSISAEITRADESSIEVRLNNGKSAKIEISRLSEADQAYVREWRDQRERELKDAAAEADARKRAAEIELKMAAYCRKQLGRRVGNGECWTLADEAFKACGLKRPGQEPRVWGRLLDLGKEEMRAGDIVEYRSARFANGAFTGPEHTAVVVRGGRRKATVAEQNWSGHKTVRETEFDPGALVAGKVMVYRPE